MSVPYVIEGSGTKERVYDLYSRLLRDRIVFIRGVFDDELATSVVAQLLFLEAQDPAKDVVMYIHSPGGYVSAALAIYDTINYIKSDVSTVCVGSAASAAAFILSSGTKGKRYALKNSRVMVHQVSSGAEGHIADLRIKLNEADVLNEILLKEFAKNTNKKIAQLRKDIDRDYYFSAEEAKKYGIVDEVLDRRV